MRHFVGEGNCPAGLPQSAFKKYVSRLSIVRNFLESRGFMFQDGETKALFSQNIAALLFINTIENENLSCPGCSSQAPVLPVQLRKGSAAGIA